LVEQYLSRKQISILEYPEYSIGLALCNFFISLRLQVGLSVGGCLESFKDKGSKMEIPEGYFENYFHKNLWMWQLFLMYVCN
jgi:hypothetical protein